MLRDMIFIAGKDVKYMLKARETLFWVFVMPIVFFYFIGTITGGFATSGAGTETVALDAGKDGGFLIDQLTRRLEENAYAVARPDSAELFARYTRQLVVPDGFTDSVLAGRPVTLEFTRNGEGIGNDYDKMRIQRATYTMLADLVALSEMGDTPTPENFDGLAEMPRALKLVVEPAGKRKRVPQGFEQSIPGIMVMFTLMVMATSGSVLLLSERREGLLRRLAYTPISRLGVVLGKWGGKLALGVVQIGFAMLAGTVLFKMDWGPDLAAVIAVMLFYGAMMAALGVVLGSVVRTEGQAVAVGVIAANVLAALGGCWWPIEITPPWMQSLQLFLPTGWAMDALHKLISFAAGPASVAPHLVGMALATTALVALSVRVFRFE
ncbi:MAG: ABC transporter permease [Candidatus Krumholzibacteriia bacterium]